MDTLLIELTDARAYKLQNDLEEMSIIKVISKTTHDKEKINQVAGFRGRLKLTEVQYKEFQDYATNKRKECRKDF